MTDLAQTPREALLGCVQSSGMDAGGQTLGWGYVETLEARIAALEALLRETCEPPYHTVPESVYVPIDWIDRRDALLAGGDSDD